MNTTPINTAPYVPAPRVYTPRIITVSVFEGDDEKPSQELITDLAYPIVSDWLQRLIFHAATHDKMVQIEPSPGKAINFMPNPNKERR